MRTARLFFLQWGPAAVTGSVVPPRRRRQFHMKETLKESHSQARNKEMSVPIASTPHRPPGGLTRTLSQREQYRAQEEQRQLALCSRGAPGEWMTPLPSRLAIDADGYEAPRLSKEERRALLQQSLEQDAASVVEFTDGGEDDIETNGVSLTEFHSRENCTTVPRESALYNAVLARNELESRMRHNSWSVSRRRLQVSEKVIGPQSATLVTDTGGPSVDPTEGVIDDTRRRRLQDEGSYSNEFAGDLLEPNYESIGQPRSTYGMRKLVVPGLTGYQGVITREEEVRICEELMLLLQDRRAAYIAEEARYCVNLYEKELGIPGKDTLAFAMNRVPTLQKVLRRFFNLSLIPCPPNICQVNEMIGNFSGYPVHKKPHTIGPYVGIMNLVSTTVMHMQHVDSPWFPRVHMNPRSLFIVEQPCIDEYKMGYKQTHQPFHAFEYATRVSKDYRIEVMFATVEAAHMRCLRESVGLTEYAERKQLEARNPGTGSIPHESHSPQPSSPRAGAEGEENLFVFSGSTDKWIERLQNRLHGAEVDSVDSAFGGAAGPALNDSIDGNMIREQLLSAGRIGPVPRRFEASCVGQEGGQQEVSEHIGRIAQSQRRVNALKARYELAKKLKEANTPVTLTGGMRVIKGQSPLGKSRL
uniref:Uncharacterized protein n=1 Tax=Trypanosoma congolense (strain IL3000) TaxID=1068625 RepID=G0UXS5_TRYCI|nr:conserved hypothetical protein [Trypanosoma congolense IL3000]